MLPKLKKNVQGVEKPRRESDAGEGAGVAQTRSDSPDIRYDNGQGLDVS
jgi:hypothetical protein